MSQKRSRTAAELLRDLREKQGQSLRGAAGEIGIAPSHLSRLENGQRAVTNELADRIASHYGINSADLVAARDGRIPDDVVEILSRHPELIEQIRERFLHEGTEGLEIGNAK